ncbi:hypothetical protein C8R47DRAFT_1204814 [Mycena vitilis]|nr:hypothetical protein C8R47DRAFT_1204814 [Mycena vitilis]
MASPDLESTFGALLIGVFIAIFFQGVLSVQAYIYYEAFPDDTYKLKFLVATVWSLDFVHLVLICQAAYHYLITNWGNDAVLLETTTPLDLHLVFLTLASIVCQSFFLRRVWRFSQNKLLTGFLAAACLATGALDIVMAVHIIEMKSLASMVGRISTGEVISVFVIGAAVDLSIALILCWYLRRELTMVDRINSLVKRIMIYSIASGLIPSLLALGCLISYLVWPQSLLFLAMHFSLGRTYTNALLATLNSRRGLRQILTPPGPSKWSDVSPTETQMGAVFAAPYVAETRVISLKQSQSNNTLSEKPIEIRKFGQDVVEVVM